MTVGQGAKGTYWVDSEKIAPDRWRAIRTNPTNYASDKTIFSNYALEDIDTIRAIRVSVIESGVRYRIWGRDAI